MKSTSEATDPLRKPAMLQKDAEAGESSEPKSIPPQALLARVLERANLQRALKQV